MHLCNLIQALKDGLSIEFCVFIYKIFTVCLPLYSNIKGRGCMATYIFK